MGFLEFSLKLRGASWFSHQERTSSHLLCCPDHRRTDVTGICTGPFLSAVPARVGDNKFMSLKR